MDLNNDGISDVVCGEHSTSVKYFLRDNSGNVTSSGTLVDDSGRTIPGDSLGNFATFTEPQIVDWNNDGLPDLVVTLSQYLNVNGYGGPGHMLLYLNTGTKEQYKFHFAGVICKQNGDTIESPAFMTAAVGDINNDGLFDIVVKDPGDYTGPATFAAYMNVGTMGSPLFADSVHIKSGDGTTNLTSDKFMNRFEIADWNGDGTNDIIADTNNGMCAGNIQVYMGIPGNVGVARKSLSTNVTSAMIFNRSQMRINLGSNLVNGGRLELVNSAGRRIFSTELTKGESFVDLGNLSKEMSKGFLYAILRHDGLEKSVPVMINSTR